jgi:hypothetical protein
MAEIIQSLGEYDNLLAEAIRLKKRHETRAKDFVPKMYSVLVKAEGLAPLDAADRIYKDLVGVWEKDTIRRLLPSEVKNQSARERQALSRSHEVGRGGFNLQNERSSSDPSKMVTHLEQQNVQLREIIEELQEEKKVLLEKTLRMQRMMTQPHPHRPNAQKEMSIVMPPHLFIKAFTLMRSSTKPLLLRISANEVVDVDKMNMGL